MLALQSRWRKVRRAASSALCGRPASCRLQHHAYAMMAARASAQAPLNVRNGTGSAPTTTGMQGLDATAACKAANIPQRYTNL